MNKVKIGLIGAGRTGTPLMENLSKYDYVEIKGVADISDDSPGMIFAKEKGIFTTTDPMDLAHMGADIDIMIEVSGDGSFKKKLKEYYEQNGNTHTVIMHDIVARLLLSVLSGSDELVATYHPGANGIG